MDASLNNRTGAVSFFQWVWDGIDRTIFTAIKFSFPARFVSPFGFLGMLTFIVFVILGISGALLMFYYQPILDRAWDSVQFINDEVPYGFHIRNIHYHGSNAMVLLAVLHMYYQYFSGRYKIRNEILWVTGVILGVVTILEAFTGYDVIFSERAQLAISIAASLTNSMPVVGPLMRDAMFGNGFSDFVLRFYAQHVFLLPLVMLGLMAVHFPRFLVFDVPMVMAISGAILITGGVFPIDMGFKFDPTIPPSITVPEWYLTGIYAFMRTQYDKFVTGMLWPLIFIIALLLTPFLDRYKKFSWRDRPIITAFGITGISQVMVTTYWGFYISPDITIPLVQRLVIESGIPVLGHAAPGASRIRVQLYDDQDVQGGRKKGKAGQGQRPKQGSHHQPVRKVDQLGNHSPDCIPGVPQHCGIQCGADRDEQPVTVLHWAGTDRICIHVPRIQVRHGKVKGGAPATPGGCLR